MGRDVLLQIPVVSVAERGVVGRLQPLANAIDADKGLELVSGVTLVEKLSEGIGRELGLLDAHLSDLNQLLGVWQLVTKSVLHSFVKLLVVQDLVLEKVLLPAIGPTFASFVPNARAGLRLAILDTRDIVAAILAHINVMLPQELLIRRKEILAEPLSQLFLEV